MDGRDDNTDNVNNSDGDALQGQSRNQDQVQSQGQGIFSTPDLTIDAEKIAPTDNEREKNRVASIFASTETGKQAQRLNDAMGMNLQPAEGDIIVKDHTKKRSKMPIVIAIVVVCVLVAGGIFFAFGSTSSDSGTIELAKKHFDQYASYILYGEEKDDLEGEFDRGGQYKLSEFFFGDNVNADFWQKSERLLEAAVSSYQKVENKNDLLAETLNRYYQDFLFISKYKAIESMGQEQLLASVRQFGVEDTKVTVAKEYNDLENISDGNTYLMEQIHEKNNYQIELLANLLSKDCVKSDGQIDEQCMLENEDDAEFQGILDGYSAVSYDLDNSLNRLISSLEQECWVINAQFDTAADTGEGEDA